MKFYAIGDCSPPNTLLKQEGLYVAEASLRDVTISYQNIRLSDAVVCRLSSVASTLTLAEMHCRCFARRLFQMTKKDPTVFVIHPSRMQHAPMVWQTSASATG